MRVCSTNSAIDRPLFVYGTLRGGSSHAFARLVRETCEFVALGRLRGSLYRIGSHPGWVEDSTDSWVIGEVVQPRDSGSLMRELDDYEGHEYARVQRTVETEGGPRQCWVYLYLPSPEGKPRIPSGDWFAT